jgi:hypothetical protein
MNLLQVLKSGLKIINADKLWALGFTGQGRMVMNIDTGVHLNHPALSLNGEAITAHHGIMHGLILFLLPAPLLLIAELMELIQWVNDRNGSR